VPAASTAVRVSSASDCSTGRVADRDVGAFASIEQGDGAPDAGIAAGDQGDLAFELAGGAVAIGAIARTRVEFGFETGRALVLLRERRPGLLQRRRASSVDVSGRPFALDFDRVLAVAVSLMGRLRVV
jgi:hypothetical protein